MVTMTGAYLSHATVTLLLLDSGATDHMFPDIPAIRNLAATVYSLDSAVHIYTAGAKSKPLEAASWCNLLLLDDTINIPIILSRVLLVQGLSKPLISISRLNDDGYDFYTSATT